ncbi:baeRF3 domain-containing protein [Robiginitalea marina]|uniref:Uncharacterized protein n=1 Tax=Robiginitalea marina TaxID=2954105 RepID=A0ABT1AUH2_9FLAO|nr:hypothetical protein [Robiginitalea marina]MCO5723252.1 hypothetical protein [Robiginitalea marina]
MMTTPNTTTNRDRISRKDLRYLTETRETHCISIYLPTHATGEEVLQGLDAQALDVELRKIRKALERAGLSTKEIDSRLSPLEALQRDGAFWREQSEGLAIFASPSQVKTFRLPLAFTPSHRISDSFYIVPLVPELNGEDEFYLLSLELERIRLFRGSRMGLAEVDLKGKVPQQMEDRVGYDYEQKGLQFRSGHQAHEGAGYHGHAEADRDRKNEIERYFRSVDKGLRPILDADPAPMLLASQEYLASLYREVTSFDQVMEEPVITNLSEVSDSELWERALAALEPVFEQEGKEKWARFEEFLGTGRASAQMDRVLRAAVEGKVDTLFIAPEAEAWGTYEEETATLTREEHPDAFSPSLLNKAVVLTLNQGGRVYVAPEAGLPKGAGAAMALFRY